MQTNQLDETLLPKKIALPIFCSDPLSSVAYATDEILLVLAIGGIAFLNMAPWVAAVIVLLLVVVVASYRQACYAYPNGGGAYVVSRANLGSNAALVAASALMVDYVLTVAVSVVAGVANIVSAFPRLAPHAVAVSIGLIILLALANLRGVRESGRLFAVPTYGFVVLILAMIGWGALRFATGHAVVAESAHYDIRTTSNVAGLATVFLALRAFASGSTALTGVEAISNGIPSFRPPKSRNAATTLSIMAVLAITMFVGVTGLALAAHVHLASDSSLLVGAPDGVAQQTVIAQLAHATFGGNVLFYAVQGFTAAILILAANTAFNGFPILASILSTDGYLPRQFSRRGDRLVFSNGIVVLALFAVVLVWAFSASTTRLIQLYVIGVFVSFTLSQLGLVRHWTGKLTAGIDRESSSRMRRARVINAVGALFTGLVLVVVLVTKFVHGAWIVTIAMPLLFFLMRAVHGHYSAVATELRPPDEGLPLPSRVHVVVLVSKLHAPTLRALGFARAMRPSTLTALTVSTNHEESAALVNDWAARGLPVDLTVLDSPYRDITGPVLDYVRGIRRKSPRDVVCVVIPEYVVGRWWEQLLHNQSALRLKARLLFQPGVMVTSVPWQLHSSEGEEIDQESPPPEPKPVAA
jgi:amino acid transporter